MKRGWGFTALTMALGARHNIIADISTAFENCRRRFSLAGAFFCGGEGTFAQFLKLVSEELGLGANSSTSSVTPSIGRSPKTMASLRLPSRSGACSIGWLS